MLMNNIEFTHIKLILYHKIKWIKKILGSIDLEI